MKSYTIEPDKLLEGGREQLLNATGKAIDLGHVNERCKIYGTDISKMTNARVFARFMSKFRLYNPLAGHHGDGYTPSGRPLPSLDAAWAHWEHVTLARHYTDNQDPSREYTRAEVGEMKRPTSLYPVWKTPVKELMAWGISVRMYFSTLLTLSIFLAIAGTLNVPLVWYFWNYAEGNKDGIANSVRGSAICDKAYWVECEDCKFLQGTYDSPQKVNLIFNSTS